MRIAFVSEHASPLAALGGDDAGGQNVYVACLATALARSGHEITVYTRRDNANVPHVVSLAPGVRVEHVPAGPATAVEKDKLLPYLTEFAGYLSSRWRHERPDVVHAHFWMSGVASLAAARPLGIAVVQTYHALGTVKRRHQGSLDTSPAERVDCERRIGNACARVIASCVDEAGELTRMGVDERRVVVIPCGVDTETFSPGDAPARADGRLRVLSLGRLVRRKGVDILVRALEYVPGAELTIAGGPPWDSLVADPEVARLRSAAARSRVTDRVRFLGAVPRKDVPGLLRSVDVVACTPWYEPFGMVPLEAMACGVPVVAAAVGGLTDTVLDGVTGLLVPPHRPDRVAEALNSLAVSPRFRRDLGQAGAARARARYSWQRIASEMCGVYQAVSGQTVDLVFSDIREPRARSR